MSKRSWKSYLRTVAFVAAIVVIVNPELRALLLVADALGFEAILLLLATQFRTFWPMLRIATEPILHALCKFSSFIAMAAMRAFPAILPFRPFALLLCPLLLVLSYGLRCPIQSQAS